MSITDIKRMGLLRQFIDLNGLKLDTVYLSNAISWVVEKEIVSYENIRESIYSLLEEEITRIEESCSLIYSYKAYGSRCCARREIMYVHHFLRRYLDEILIR